MRESWGNYVDMIDSSISRVNGPSDGSYSLLAHGPSPTPSRLHHTAAVPVHRALGLVLKAKFPRLRLWKLSLVDARRVSRSPPGRGQRYSGSKSIRTVKLRSTDFLASIGRC